MTHAFFKALLFMAAGSVIGAMANRQNIDLMGGFRKSMPFTCALLLIGCLALAAFPGTSGFFSKDEILAFAEYRGGFYWIFAIGGYIGALLTAIYAFRIGFRVAFGEPCDEARDLEQGVHAHLPSRRTRPPGSPRTPTSASPARSTTIAERKWPMKIAMSVLGLRRPVRGARPGAGRRPGDPQLPRGLVRGLDALLRGALHQRRVARARDRRR